MSDLAPFVAAAIRDKVVKELHEENRCLQSKGPSWTVQVTGSGGSPLYSSGKISQREVLQQISERHTSNNHIDNINVAMQGGEEAVVACCLESFLQCQLILTTSLGRKIIQNVDSHGADIGNGIRAHRGRFEIGWDFFTQDTVFGGLYLDMPIPTDRLNTLDPSLVNGLGITREDALPLAQDTVNRDAPIRFSEVYLNTHALIGTLS